VPSYLARVLKRAATDTMAFVKPHKVLYAAGVGIGGSVIAASLFGLTLSEDWWKIAASGFLANAIGFGVVYLGNVIAAPARLDRDRLAEIRELEVTLAGAQRQIGGQASPRIRVEIGEWKAREQEKTELGIVPRLWGLRVLNDGASAVFRVLLEVKRGVVGIPMGRHYIAFSHSGQPTAAIASGAEDKFFVGRIDWYVFYDQVGSKALFYFDDRQRRNVEALLHGTEGMFPATPVDASADVEITITSEPQLAEGPWRRMYRFGPERLTELPPTEPRLVDSSSAAPNE
jgi:hypothetical protein